MLRKNKIIAEVLSPSWKPQVLISDGDQVLVGDCTGRVTLSTIDKLEQVPFESNVIARMPSTTPARYQAASVCSIAVGANHLLVCSDQGSVGMCQFPKIG